MNNTSSQATSSQGKTQNQSAQNAIGQSDTKEILLLGSGLLILVLGLGGLLMYSEDEPLPATTSHESQEVDAFQMTRAFATPTPPSTTPIPSEPRPEMVVEPSLHFVTNAPEIQQPKDTNIYFAFNRWALTDEAKDIIKTKVEEKPDSWTGTFRIDGHTDAQGSDTYNVALGLKRAESVKTYLVTLGIQEDTIELRSFGKDGAVCQDQTPDCFEHNRRAHVAFHSQPVVQQDDTLLSMAPDSLGNSTQEVSPSMIDPPSFEVIEDEIVLQEEIPGELVAIDPLASAESLP